LNKSPRHNEWVDLKHGDRTVKSVCCLPGSESEGSDRARHSRNFWPDGLGEETSADELAAAGYIAIAAPICFPPPGKDTSNYSDQGDAIKVISAPAGTPKSLPILDAAGGLREEVAGRQWYDHGDRILLGRREVVRLLRITIRI